MSALAEYGTNPGWAPAWVFASVDTYAAGLGVRGKQPVAIGALSFLVTRHYSADRRELARYEPPVHLLIHRTPTGRLIFLNEVTDTAGVTRRPYFRPGHYDLRIEAEFYQTAILENVFLPQSEQALVVNLQPGYRYPFPRFRRLQNGGCTTLLRGCVLTPDGRGVANARVEAVGREPSVSYLTDSTGQFVLVFAEDQGDEVVSVSIAHPGGQTLSVDGVPLSRGKSTSLPLTRLKGRVLGAQGSGIAGVPIRVEGFDGTSLSGTGGDWCYTFPLNQASASVRVIAEGPNGTLNPSDPVEVTPGTTVRGPVIRIASR